MADRLAGVVGAGDRRHRLADIRIVGRLALGQRFAGHVTVPYSTVPPLSSSSPLLVTVIATMPATTTTTATTAMIRMVRARDAHGASEVVIAGRRGTTSTRMNRNPHSAMNDSVTKPSSRNHGVVHGTFSEHTSELSSDGNHSTR